MLASTVRLLHVVVQQLQLDPFRRLRNQRPDRVVEGGELRLAVDGVGRLLVVEHADSAHDSGSFVAEDQYGLERRLMTQKIGGKLRVDLSDLIEVSGLRVQREFGYVHGAFLPVGYLGSVPIAEKLAI